MHERSLVRTLLEQVREECDSRGIGSLTRVRIGVGAFSGVEPKLMETAFDELSHSYFSSPVTLVVDRIPLCGQCRECQEVFEILDFRFVCPVCDGRDLQIISGNELQLISLTTQEDSYAPPDANSIDTLARQRSAEESVDSDLTRNAR